MIVKEYCESMGKQLAAWRSNVQKLLLIAEQLPGKYEQADVRRQKALQSIIDDLGSVSELLKKECMPA